MQENNEPCTLRLGVSTCLLGERVRYDGGHKRDRYLTEELGPYVEWVPVCPEVEIGLPIPRETLRLVRGTESPRLIMPKSGRDYTEVMQSWAVRRLDELGEIGLHGFIFKKDSPSSGLYRVRVYDHNGVPKREGTGVFAAEVRKRFPLLPLEEEGRLNDPRLRENFIDRIFIYYRWTCMLESNPSPGGLVQFHTAHKLTLMAHSPQAYRELGPVVATAGSLPWDDLVAAYGQRLMTAVEELTTPGRHVNVMQHLMGYLKNDMDSADKMELLGIIEDYRQGLLPLIVPLTLLKHHLNRNDVPDWVHQQVYLNPYPKELMLHNHV